MRTICIEVMNIGDEAYLVENIECGTVKKMLISGVKIWLEEALGKPSISYKVGDFGYYAPGRVFRTAKEAFDAVDAAQSISPQEMHMSY